MNKTTLYLSLWLLSSLLKGQPTLSYYLPQDLSYNPSIPTPASIAGHEVGEWHLTHDKLLAYMKAIDAASDRAVLFEIGKTFEGRPLVHLIFTSPQNHQRLEEIRREHLKLTDPTLSASLKIDNMPLVLWMGYSIHGNEASGSNASVLSAYYLAAAQGREIEDMLDKMVIIVDPSFNPDGMQRFSTWVNSNRGINQQVGDPNNREQNEVWPGGRTNHYWFDLNRDWLPVQLPESQARIEQFHRWKPNFLTDHHEMGTNSTFFMQPGHPSRNHPLIPDQVVQITRKMAGYHAAELNKIGSLYYTQEGFDDFYFGKGSTYPDINGGVGILFEQASSRGHGQESDNGFLSFPFTIRNHFTTSLSTMKGTYALRTELLGHQRDFYQSAINEGGKHPIQAYVVAVDQDPARAGHFVDILRRHQIQVYKLAQNLNLQNQTYTAGNAFIVPIKQAQFRLIRAMFEKQTVFKDSLFYDISTWTLPIAFGLRFSEVATASYASRLLGEPLERGASLQITRETYPSNYAYILDWKHYNAPRAVYDLQNMGLRMKVATKKHVDNEGRNHDYGSILIPVMNQDLPADRVQNEVRSVAQKYGLQLYSLTSGLSEQGIDLGSNAFEPIKEPKIALLVGNGISANDAGEIWHLLDQRYHMPVTLLPIERIGQADLRRYNTLIMTDGNYQIASPVVEKIKGWISEGNVLIAMQNAVNWVAQQQIAPVKFKTAKPSKSATDSLRLYSYENRENIQGAKVTGGVIFQAKMDRSHPIAYGYDRDEIALFRSSNSFMEPIKNSDLNPLVYTPAPLISGYIQKDNYKLGGNSAAVQIARNGAGRVVLMSDNPAFRAFWFGTNRLLMNAIFFGKIM